MYVVYDVYALHAQYVQYAQYAYRPNIGLYPPILNLRGMFTLVKVACAEFR